MDKPIFFFSKVTYNTAAEEAFPPTMQINRKLTINSYKSLVRFFTTC